MSVADGMLCSWNYDWVSVFGVANIVIPGKRKAFFSDLTQFVYVSLALSDELLSVPSVYDSVGRQVSSFLSVVLPYIFICSSTSCI